MGRWLRGGGARLPPAVPGRGAAGGPAGGPALGPTLARYLGVLEALLGPAELAQSRRLVEAFGAPGGAGPRLQARLRQRPPPDDPHGEWPWGPRGRLPLPVHSSPALVLPRQQFDDWRGQLWFAARLIAGVLDYREHLERRDPPAPWVAAAFGACRVPGPRRDELLGAPPGRRPPNFITVVRNYQFFQLEVYRSDGAPLAEAQLHAQLQRLRAQSWKTDKEPLGVLTGDHRHSWGQAYAALLRERLNRESAGRLRRGLFVLSLDAPVLKVSDGRLPARVAAQLLHGGGSRANSGNRWFDKGLQFIVGEDGTCGVLYDQAVIDAAAVAEMADHVLDYCRNPPPSRAPLTPLPLPRKLYFVLEPELLLALERARRHLDSLIADVDFVCFDYEGFGEALPRGRGLPPGALAQVALQVAYYRTHGALDASCEPVVLPPPLPGGTDVVRPPAGPCLALARALEDPGCQPGEQLQLLREAVEAQCEVTELVRAGGGPDGHLQRLRQEAIAGGERLPELFMDPGYAVATHFRLCSVQVSSRGGCWPVRGPLVPDGYGAGLAPGPGGLRVALAAFACCRRTRAPALAAALRGALDQLGGLLRGGPPP